MFPYTFLAAVKFPEISRFSRQLLTLINVINVRIVCMLLTQVDLYNDHKTFALCVHSTAWSQMQSCRCSTVWYGTEMVLVHTVHETLTFPLIRLFSLPSEWHMGSMTDSPTEFFSFKWQCWQTGWCVYTQSTVILWSFSCVLANGPCHELNFFEAVLLSTCPCWWQLCQSH